MDPQQQPPHAEGSAFRHAEVSFEPKDADARLVLLTLVGLLIVIFVCAAILWGLYGRWRAEEYGGEPVTRLMRQYIGRMLPPEPRLQGSPGSPEPAPEELRQMRDHNEQLLNGYGWVDQRAGVARIPIGEAMKLLAQRGLGQAPPREQTAPNLSSSR